MERQQALSQIGKRPALLSEVVLTGRDGDVHRFEFSSVMSVVTGRNGGGKTTLLRALEGFLSNPIDYRSPLFASANLKGSRKGVQWTAVTGGLERPDFPVVYVDIVKTVLHLISRVEEDQEPGDWLDGIDPAPLDKNLASWAQYIIGRDYEEVLVYEVTAFSSEDEAQPYFRARAHGKTYDSADMGRGELATFHLLWQLSRLESGSLVFIEEPESNLAEYSQSRMLEALAALAKDEDHQFIVASHYPGAFNGLPGTVVVEVQKLPAFCVEPVKCPVEEDSLGAGGRTVSAFVEDDVAMALLQCLVENLAPAVADSLMVWKLGSESALTRLSKELGERNRGQAGLLLILDGDQRSYATVRERAMKEPWLCCLPGAWAPEESLKRLLQEDLGGSKVLAPDVSRLLARALRENEGLDIHDWFFACAEKFGSYLNLWRSVWPLLMSREGNRRQAEELASRLLKAAG